MNRTLQRLLLVAPAALSGCRATGSGSLDVHEALLYGAAREHVVWVYGTLAGEDRGQVTLNGQSTVLTAGAPDGALVPGTLSVNGKATYRFASQPLNAPFSAAETGTGTIQVTHRDSSVAAAFYTDGTRWTRLEGTTGTVGLRQTATLRGAGNLTDAEADSLGAALLHQGPLVVAVLTEGSLPDAALKVDPAPARYLRTGLYLSAPTRPAGSSPITTPPTTGGSVEFTVLASGTNASVTTGGVEIASTQAEIDALLARVNGRQTSAATSTPTGGTVIGVFLGQRPTGGYSVRVLSVSKADNVLTVRVQVHAPGPGAITTQALTSPWTLIRVPGTYAQVRVVDMLGQPLPTGGTGRTDR
ncbi:protease complex subunit PrcB family protein [Deinococcus sp. KSM4-11]|uniref:protease complex subunit PrcB family protein n=1 Tax=Deinococcus sp. KSM4-11 TaxID=2568654 RepID=UPI0010A2FFDB|nr:protease complex subunit PrcB family protein [Deinococcus sp. KSM4-11]THF88255.1 protease complex subunit PrcB family protein [Deinococcus sp. KSM4-11]